MNPRINIEECQCRGFDSSNGGVSSFQREIGGDWGDWLRLRLQELEPGGRRPRVRVRIRARARGRGRVGV